MKQKEKLLQLIHPGEILKEESMRPMGISINRLARDIDVPPGRISMLVNGKRSIIVSVSEMLRLPVSKNIKNGIYLSF